MRRVVTIWAWIGLLAVAPAATQARAQAQPEIKRQSQERQRGLMLPIQARVSDVIHGLRAEGNYALIFDADYPTSNMVAAGRCLDITPEVIERLTQAK